MKRQPFRSNWSAAELWRVTAEENDKKKTAAIRIALYHTGRAAEHLLATKISDDCEVRNKESDQTNIDKIIVKVFGKSLCIAVVFLELE